MQGQPGMPPEQMPPVQPGQEGQAQPGQMPQGLPPEMAQGGMQGPEIPQGQQIPPELMRR
jgi:hypothetical protein